MHRPRMLPRLQPELKAKACELYKSGISLSYVARELKLHDNMVRKILLEAGVPVRKPWGEKK